MPTRYAPGGLPVVTIEITDATTPIGEGMPVVYRGPPDGWAEWPRLRARYEPELWRSRDSIGFNLYIDGRKLRFRVAEWLQPDVDDVEAERRRLSWGQGDTRDRLREVYRTAPPEKREAAWRAYRKEVWRETWSWPDEPMPDPDPTWCGPDCNGPVTIEQEP